MIRSSFPARRWISRVARTALTLIRTHADHFVHRNAQLVLSERPLLPQHVVIMLGEPVGLVADVLKQPQGERAAAEDDRVGPAGDVDLLLALGQGDQGRRVRP